jgi:arginase
MNIDLIGVPIDFGAGRRGVDMGPSAIRYGGLAASLEHIGHSVHDTGNIAVAVMESRDEQNPKLRYLKPILETCAAVADRVADSLALNHLPLTIGGDHSLSLGSLRGATRRHNLGVIWIDAHGDFNTAETSPSGNIHGMPLAALCGLGDARLVKLGNPARTRFGRRRTRIVTARGRQRHCDGTD